MTDQQISAPINVLRYTNQITPLQKDILDTWDELQKESFDAESAHKQIFSNTFIEQTMRSDSLTAIDGTTMKLLVDRIQIRNEVIVVEFKCGVAIEQEYVR